MVENHTGQCKKYYLLCFAEIIGKGLFCSLICCKQTTRQPPCELERVAGIEPAHSAWEADRLPLHHTRH